jgi:hypothetical protein
MKASLGLLLLLAASLQAETVNLVNLVSRDSTQFTLSQGGKQETFQLPAGASSGKFKLEGETILACREVPGEELLVPFTEKPSIAVFHEASGKPEWLLLPSSPSEGVLSLRIFNLHSAAVSLKINGEQVTVDAGSSHSVAGAKGRKVTVEAPEKEAKASFEPHDPSAGLALVFKQEDQWKIVIVPDI